MLAIKGPGPSKMTLSNSHNQPNDRGNLKCKPKQKPKKGPAPVTSFSAAKDKENQGCKLLVSLDPKKGIVPARAIDISTGATVLSKPGQQVLRLKETTKLVKSGPPKVAKSDNKAPPKQQGFPSKWVPNNNGHPEKPNPPKETKWVQDNGPAPHSNYIRDKVKKPVGHVNWGWQYSNDKNSYQAQGKRGYNPNRKFHDKEVRTNSIPRPPPRSSSWFELYGLTCDFREVKNPSRRFGNTVVHRDGYITLRPVPGYRIDMTVSQSVRIQNDHGNTIMSLSSSGKSMSIIHPQGRVYKYGDCVEFDTAYSHSVQKYAKILPAGVAFTCQTRPNAHMTNTYRINPSWEKFSDLSHDFSVPVFLDNADYGRDAVDECLTRLHDTRFWRNPGGDYNWIVNGFHITTLQNGKIIVRRNNGMFSLLTSSTKTSIYAPDFQLFANVGSFLVQDFKHGSRELENKHNCLFIRDNGLTAGFNAQNEVHMFGCTP